MEWTDETPSLDEILASVSLYWLTDTFPRAIYPYREVSCPSAFCAPKFISRHMQCIDALDLESLPLLDVTLY